MVFQLVRNTTAIWRNAARYCWFKMDLFISKLYTNPARERKGDVRAHQNGKSPPTALQHPQPFLTLPQETDPALPRALSTARAWKQGGCPWLAGGTTNSSSTGALRGWSQPQPCSKEQGR